MAKTKKNIFIQIDEFIFQKIDLFKNDSSFQKINDVISNLDEAQQKVLAQILTFSFLLLPYILVLFLLWGNHSIKKRIEVKNQILDQISILNGNRDSLASVSSNYIAPSAIMGQEDLDNKIRNIASSASIDQSKLNIMNYNQISSTPSITKVEAKVGFKNFGTQDFSNFMRSVVEIERFKVMGINLSKNKTSQLLEGDVLLMHLGKNAEY